ncbi:MAG: leucine-rich repeat domain-containing protein [Patescibacteria group bacterium]
MNYFGIIALLIVVAMGAWWGGSRMSTTNNVVDEPTVYENVLDSAKQAADKLSTDSKQPTTETNAPAPTPTKTIDPGTGKSIEVYKGISVSEGTTALNLSSRGLSGSLKGEIRFLTNLKQLNISDNNFTGLPAEVGQLSKLEILNLSNNPFTGLPNELANLKSLKILDLRGTQYAKQDLEVIKKGLPASTQILVD